MLDDASIEDNEARINEIIITQTNERISQELSNLSADELKANVLAGIAPFFALLAVSQNWQFFNPDSWYIAVPFLITVITLVIAFLLALFILRPKAAFDLWDPVSSNEEYSKMITIEAKETLKHDLIEAYNSIEKSREKLSKLIKLGYSLLIGGSVGSLVILIVAQIFDKAFTS